MGDGNEGQARVVGLEIEGPDDGLLQTEKKTNIVVTDLH